MRFTVDTSAMSPRYNPGDELFLRPFSAAPGKAADLPDILVYTSDGRFHIGQLCNRDANGVTITLLSHEKKMTIRENRLPILYEIIGTTSAKLRPVRKTGFIEA